MDKVIVKSIDEFYDIQKSRTKGAKDKVKRKVPSHAIVGAYGGWIKRRNEIWNKFDTKAESMPDYQRALKEINNFENNYPDLKRYKLDSSGFLRKEG